VRALKLDTIDASRHVSKMNAPSPTNPQFMRREHEYTQAEIAHPLRRHPRTVSRELNSPSRVALAV
jgi:IS30 family transposase